MSTDDAAKKDAGLDENGRLHVFDQGNGVVPPARDDVYDPQTHRTQPERIGGLLPLDGD